MRKAAWVWALCLLVFLTGGCANREKAYYSDRNNYLIDTAMVGNVVYDEEVDALYLWLDDVREEYSDTTFVIRGESVELLLEREALETIVPGCAITYVSAPEYFGDGYCMPVVALSVGEETLLDFEEGYENLLRVYS